ncbi:MAG: TlpA family protein disulfide reductase [Polyangiaceae bacterium]|nr:TlpA family protein disulfide reductase [Polyangiaceae bacterium]
MRLLMSAGVLSAALLAVGCAQQGTEAGAATGGTTSTGLGAASDFTARDLDGKTVKLSNYLGKQAILLSFCATWCEPCVAEFPHLRRLYDANKAKGFVILAIAMDGPETVARVPAFAARNQLNFPVLTDEDSRITAIYNPQKSAPLSVLIDKQGRMVAIREGYNPGDEEYLAKDVAKVLDGSTAPQ